jgi:hypothetical protein
MDEGVRGVARILRALQLSNKSLTAYYSELKTMGVLGRDGKPIPPHFREVEIGGTQYKLDYTKRLAEGSEEKAVFVANLESEGSKFEAVVKFAHSYCEAAHKLLVNELLAPRLHFCKKLEDVGMYVVIMDLVKEPAGITEMLGDQEFTTKVAKNMEKAVRLLHAAGMVHGDLRRPNILVQESGNVQIIDFDWCGKEGEVRYPATINLAQIHWADGVTREGMIKKEHDREMLKDLLIQWK